MDDHATALATLTVGALIHAESPNGASLICLVTSITDTKIFTRTVTTQIELEFNRGTGIAEWGDDSVSCTIDSIAPLPSDIHNVMLGIDRKFGFEQGPKQHRLSEDEKRALLFVDTHYSSNPL
jgi:hypothetical protein